MKKNLLFFLQKNTYKYKQIINFKTLRKIYLYYKYFLPYINIYLKLILLKLNKKINFRTNQILVVQHYFEDLTVRAGSNYGIRSVSHNIPLYMAAKTETTRLIILNVVLALNGRWQIPTICTYLYLLQLFYISLLTFPHHFSH